MNDIIVAITITGNVILCLLMLFRGWAARLQWFTIMAALAVLAEALFFLIIHKYIHRFYAPARIAVQYWMFPALMILCAIEAARIRMRWLERLMLIQVGMAIVAGVAHLRGDPSAVYYLEYASIWVNIAGIVLLILKFRGAPRYEPSKA